MTPRSATTAAGALALAFLMVGGLPAQADTAGVMSKVLEATGSEGARAGVVDGHTYLGNALVAYVWAPGEQGAGLLCIYDKVSGRELLKVGPASAAMWRIDMKEGRDKEKKTYASGGLPCKVSYEVKGEEARVSFTWSDRVNVRVETRLAAGESLARSRIRVKTSGGQGLKTVVFPVVTGIGPMTVDGAKDEILDAANLGWTKPSPVVTGKAMSRRYPIENSLQMGALLGEGRGLYFGEEDGEANEKTLAWEPNAEEKTLAFSISHNVLGWGGEEPVKAYASPGDVVMGPFQGDWFDAARIYRKWALTAPWAAKGPIEERADYPKWLIRVGFWANGGLDGEEGIGRALVKHEFFRLPESVCHDYYYMFADYYHHNRNPEYLPPRIGSENYKRVVRDFHKRGIRVVPYVIGWLWNMSTESYQAEDAEHKGAMCGPSGDVYWTWAGGLDPQAAMCPATDIWRDKLLELSVAFIKEYGLDGVYFDYFSVHCADCFVKSHGHPIGGGNYWTKSVHELYERIREECHKINPEAMFCGENVAEWCIDVLDTSYTGGPDCTAPVFMAVYHGYTQTFGGLYNQYTPPYIGRMWIMGCENGPTNQELPLATGPEESYKKLGPWYRELLRCRWEFGWPYLGCGEMLRPPKVEGDIPTITQKGAYGDFTLPGVDSTAWRARDGSVGIFFLNYDGERSYDFTWTEDLGEFAGIGADKKLRVTRWTSEGEEDVGKWSGGVVTQNASIEPWGMIALRLEVVP
ncbi:MAG: DUF6259 domain-containing protein [Planctomycetota bacterium]